MAKISVKKLANGSGFIFSSDILPAAEAKAIDLALTKEGFDLSRGVQEVRTAPEEQKSELDKFYGD